MKIISLTALLLLPPAVLAGTSLQRYLASLRLGDTFKQIQTIYPPTREWSKHREPGGGIVRINIERGYSRWFPSRVSTVSLGMHHGRLVHIQLIYNREQSRKKPLSELAVDLSLLYGEPRRDGETYFWSDSKTVIAVSYAELPTARGRGRELRTSLELMERSYFEPLR